MRLDIPFYGKKRGIMRRLLIAGNWKMHKNIEESIALAQKLKASLLDITELDMLVCPTYTSLYPVAKVLAGSNIAVGAQNMYFEDAGAFTGEISADMIGSTGARYVILGHSERRHVFGESNDSIAKKLKKALDKQLTPIVCIGELLEERESGKMESVLKEQLSTAFSDLTSEQVNRTVIAYEPVWAIGTGVTATPDQAQSAHKFVRDWFTDNFDKETANRLTILYGGSVKPDNIAELAANPDVDGALIGGASLKADSFTEIVQNAIKEEV